MFSMLVDMNGFFFLEMALGNELEDQGGLSFMGSVLVWAL